MTKQTTWSDLNGDYKVTFDWNDDNPKNPVVVGLSVEKKGKYSDADLPPDFLMQVFRDALHKASLRDELLGKNALLGEVDEKGQIRLKEGSVKWIIGKDNELVLAEKNEKKDV